MTKTTSKRTPSAAKRRAVSTVPKTQATKPKHRATATRRAAARSRHSTGWIGQTLRAAASRVAGFFVGRGPRKPKRHRTIVRSG